MVSKVAAWRSAPASQAAPPLLLDRGDLDALRLTRPNVLLCGPAEVTRAAVRALAGALGQPAKTWSSAQPLPLPHPSTPAPSVVIEDVDRLPLDEQRRLSDWLLAAHRHTQVMSTTRRPLLPLVESGRFLAELYYRLNVVYLELAA